MIGAMYYFGMMQAHIMKTEPAKFQDMLDHMGGMQQAKALWNQQVGVQLSAAAADQLRGLQNYQQAWVARWYDRKLNRSVIPPGALVKNNPQFLKRI